MSFLNNIVADLWEKHLVPVVAVLALAAVAIPVTLRKDGEVSRQSTGTQIHSLAKSSTQQPLVAEADPQAKTSRKLEAFQRKNPFVQQAQHNKGSDSGSVTPTGSGTSAGGGTSGAVSSGGESSSASAGASPVVTSSGSSATAAFYRNVITMRFGVGPKDKLRLREDLVALYPLPSSKNPVVTFVGISPHSRSAVFLLDRGVTQSGEGTCMPSKSNCTYLYLKEDADHNEHTVYRLASRQYKLKLKSIDLSKASKGTVKLLAKHDYQKSTKSK